MKGKWEHYTYLLLQLWTSRTKTVNRSWCFWFPAHLLSTTGSGGGHSPSEILLQMELNNTKQVPSFTCYISIYSQAVFWYFIHLWHNTVLLYWSPKPCLLTFGFFPLVVYPHEASSISNSFLKSLIHFPTLTEIIFPLYHLCFSHVLIINAMHVCYYYYILCPY